jgi:hypothetical protein
MHCHNTAQHIVPQINHARKLIDEEERHEGVASLLSVNRTTLYRALAGSCNTCVIMSFIKS